MAGPHLSRDVVVEKVRWTGEDQPTSSFKNDHVFVGESLVRGMETAFRGYFAPVKYRDKEQNRDLRGFVQVLIHNDEGLITCAEGGEEEMARLTEALKALDTFRTESAHYSWGDFLDLLGPRLGGADGAIYEKGIGFVPPGEDHGKSLTERAAPYFQRARNELDRIFCMGGSRDDFMRHLQEKNPGEYQDAPLVTPGVAPSEEAGEFRESSAMDIDEHDQHVADNGESDDVLRSKDKEIAAIEEQLAALKMGRVNSLPADSGASSSGSSRLRRVKEATPEGSTLARATAPPLQQSSRWQSELQVSQQVQARMAVKESQAEASKQADDTFLRKGPLSRDQEREVDFAFGGGPDSEVLVKAFNADLTRRDLKCLAPYTWLNDEVVNMYMQLLGVRDKDLCNANPARRPSHFFNSFFLTKLQGNDGKYNYMGVRRWTRKVKVFEMDKIFVPVNVSNTHWCMAVIYMRHKRIRYYDSMGGRGKRVTLALLRWLGDEHKDKKVVGPPFEPGNWTTESADMATTPQQENGSDCGVFAVSFASYISDDLPLNFRQADITQMRRRMLWSLVNQCLV